MNCREACVLCMARAVLVETLQEKKKLRSYKLRWKTLKRLGYTRSALCHSSMSSQPHFSKLQARNLRDRALGNLLLCFFIFIFFFSKTLTLFNFIYHMCKIKTNDARGVGLFLPLGFMAQKCMCICILGINQLTFHFRPLKNQISIFKSYSNLHHFDIFDCLIIHLLLLVC